MSSNDQSVHLLVPGLLGPIPSLDSFSSLPQLETLLSRADNERVSGDDLESTLFPLFGIDSSPESDLPTAPCRRIGDGCDRDERFYLQANPVFLRPDQDRLLLFDSEDLDFTKSEAESLAGLFSEHFSAESWRLEIATPHRWYLALDDQPSLTTASLSRVFGRNIDPLLPQGRDSMRWHGIMNEVQMLFHGTNLNFERESCGKLPINGLWFSGGGRFNGNNGSIFCRVYSNEALTRGLGLATGTDTLALPTDAAMIKAEGGSTLVTYDRIERTVWRADPYDWFDELGRFEVWLAPMIDGLRQKKIRELLIYPCNGALFRLSSSRLRRFWCRRRGVDQWAESSLISA